MSEVNPNHPVTQMVHDHWHKVCVILMMRMGVSSVEITEDDVQALGDNERAVVADCRGGRFIVRLDHNRAICLIQGWGRAILAVLLIGKLRGREQGVPGSICLGKRLEPEGCVTPRTIIVLTF